MTKPETTGHNKPFPAVAALRQAERTLQKDAKGTKRYVVLGCGGFIGSHLLDRLMEDETVFVEGFDIDDRKIAGHLADPRLRLHRGYLHHSHIFESLVDALDTADAVINLAAICNPSQYNTRPLDVINSNFIDVFRLVELCATRNKWLIHYSTSEVYGRTIASYLPGNTYDNPDLYELAEDETPLIMGPIKNQRWSYAASKQLLERFIFAMHYEHGLPFTIVRPFNFFGPRMDFIPGRDGEGIPRVLACFMTALLDREPMKLVDGGLARRTIISIHDAISALMLMLEKPDRARNEIFNIGSRGNEVTMAELAELMRTIYADVADDPTYRHHPIDIVSSEEFYGKGYEDCDRRVPNLDKVSTLLGWQAQVPLYDTLKETIEYYHALYGGGSANNAEVRVEAVAETAAE